jgi:hypothetical protein
MAPSRSLFSIAKSRHPGPIGGPPRSAATAVFKAMNAHRPSWAPRLSRHEAVNLCLLFLWSFVAASLGGAATAPPTTPALILRVGAAMRNITPPLGAGIVGGWTDPPGTHVELVRDGHPAADIVVPEQPPRMTRLAAEELQAYLEKISGARLQISSSPGNNLASHIYVGRSLYTDRLNISDEGLAYGAFKVISGKDYLVLLGDDTDFIPPEPYARNPDEIPAMMKKWDSLTGSTWGNPAGTSLGKRYHKEMGIWQGDKCGSLNAVHEFLRRLGVRWYMPGELGEIVPATPTILVGKLNEVVRPDFNMRRFYFAFYNVATKEDIMWYRRLALSYGEDVIGLEDPGHGIENVMSRDEMKKSHPEYYAIWGGKRMAEKEGKACLSSEGLIQENVRYVRAMFDIYNVPMVSVMPQDGYGQLCECELCKGKDTPGRGKDGVLSDYVWDYVNRVAQEVYKTHPDRKISCFAYGTYTLPPEKIDQLSPNLIIGIVGCRRFYDDRGTRWMNGHSRAEKDLLPNTEANRLFNQFLALRKVWMGKLSSGKMFQWEHYPFTGPGRAYIGVPAYFPHLIGEDLRSLKGISLGEFVEVGAGGRGMTHNPAFEHLNIYVSSRLYWNIDQGVDALLDEYYQKFYGPAAEEMKSFIEYCEKNWYNPGRGWIEFQKNPEKLHMLRELAGKALDKAPAGSVYSERIRLINNFVGRLKIGP